MRSKSHYFVVVVVIQSRLLSLLFWFLLFVAVGIKFRWGKNKISLTIFEATFFVVVVVDDDVVIVDLVIFTTPT